MRDRERTRAATIVAHPLGGDPQRAVPKTAGEERRKCDEFRIREDAVRAWNERSIGMGMRGPAPDLFSGRSERNGRTAGIIRLPARGCRKRAPKYPLTPLVQLAGEQDDVESLRALDVREHEVWRELWHLPQAVAWHMPEYAYLVQTVAMYTRAVVRAEQSFANAADRTVLLRYADMIGMTPNGLARLGWLIVEDDEPNTKPQLHVVTPSAYTDPRDEWEEMEEDV